MGGACSRYGERRSLKRVLVGKPEGISPLGMSRRRWKDNIKMNFRKSDGRVWSGSSWLRI